MKPALITLVRWINTASARVLDALEPAPAPTTKRYGDFGVGDRVEVIDYVGFEGWRGNIIDLNDAVAAVRFSKTSAATLRLTQLRRVA